jgi:hypothetical protein
VFPSNIGMQGHSGVTRVGGGVILPPRAAESKEQQIWQKNDISNEKLDFLRQQILD